eukprot:6306246-Alexandrium_andersonii.AAC.1
MGAVQREKKRGPIWQEGELSIVKRADRDPLLSLKNRKKQILQVKLSYFKTGDAAETAFTCLKDP